MMPPKKHKGLVINPEELSLLCEWDGCGFLTASMEEFVKHASLHLAEHMKQLNITEQISGCYNCKWRDCSIAIIGHVSDFTRHVYFHTFHTKIKCVGNILISKYSVQECTLDGQSRNLIPELPERLQCGWTFCEAVYDNPEFFYRHVDFHADNYPEGNNVTGGCACNWEGCDVNVKSKHKLREHLRSHTQEKVVACPNCGGLFSNRTKFFDHLKRQEGVEVECYQCSHCNKKFPIERLLRDHIRHHVNSYKCPLCDMTCPNPASLRNHVKYRHTSEKPYKCADCDYRCKSAADLRRHVETHNSEPTFHCHIEGCNFNTRCYQTLAGHFEKVHQGINLYKYACHVCEKVFTRGAILTHHLKRQHNFKWPSGHSRFRYRLNDDGYWRLQTVRYESVELVEQILGKKLDQPQTTDSELLLNAEEPQQSTSTVGESVDEINVTYNLEMLGDVALLSPGSLEVMQNKQNTSGEASIPLVAGESDLVELS